MVDHSFVVAVDSLGSIEIAFCLNFSDSVFVVAVEQVLHYSVMNLSLIHI